ncbi:hypothetical protein BT63DRAFT_429517 [Microthyrium microscopicum]|uniref:Uncharacterized protein n=1 Tax=Microthyrium microscopicum TaxID=703497 RepID=A0A6A6TZD7_9PEZI|nr:hypothetical protein BT63DRAFT_429517 [Microthyrium microscopicum]
MVQSSSNESRPTSGWLAIEAFLSATCHLDIVQVFSTLLVLYAAKPSIYRRVFQNQKLGDLPLRWSNDLVSKLVRAVTWLGLHPEVGHQVLYALSHGAGNAAE